MSKIKIEISHARMFKFFTVSSRWNVNALNAEGLCKLLHEFAYESIDTAYTHIPRTHKYINIISKQLRKHFGTYASMHACILHMNYVLNGIRCAHE